MPTPGERPTARVNGVMVFDPGREALWLMGGNQSEHGTQYLPTNDVWSYSVSEERWQQHNVSVGPAPRFFHAGLFDAERGSLVVYGGADENSVAGVGNYFDDLWALDVGSLEWTELAAEGAKPAGRFSAGLVHDTSRDEYVLAFGHDAGALGNRNDTWRFLPGLRSWRFVGSEDGLGAADVPDACERPVDFVKVEPELPERRHAHTLSWSEPCEHALSFGGKTDCGSSDDVWAYAGRRWTERLAAREGEVCVRATGDAAECGSLCF